MLRKEAAPLTLWLCVIARGGGGTAEAINRLVTQLQLQQTRVTRWKTFLVESRAAPKPQIITFAATGAAKPPISRHLRSDSGRCGG